MGARSRSVQRFFYRVLLALGVVAVFLLVLATQTPVGKEWVLREALARVSGGIQGSIQVEGVSSPGLLNGFTFRDVTIRGPDGTVFLKADSVRAGISGPALLRGGLIVTGIHLWRPQITLVQANRDERVNAEVIFGGRPLPAALASAMGSEPSSQGSTEPRGDSVPGGEGDTVAGEGERGEEGAGRRRTVTLRDAEIHDGTLNILLPLPEGEYDGSRMLVQPGSDDRPPLRRYTFRELQLDLGQAVLRTEGQEGERFEVRNLSFLGEVWPEPIRVTGAEGEVRREGGRLLASLASLQLPGSRTQGQVDVRWGGEAGTRLSIEGQAAPLSLEDISAIESRLPGGRARGPFALKLDDNGLLLEFRNTQLDSELGGIQAQGGLFLGAEIRLLDLAMVMTDLDLSVTDPWVRDTLSLRGRVTGDLTLTGDLDQLELQGLVDLVDPDSAGVLTADVIGRIGLRDGFSASSLHLTLAPLEWGTLASVSPGMNLTGPGSVRMTLTGSLAGGGLGIDGELTHVPAGTPLLGSAGGAPGGAPSLGSAAGASRVVVAGTIRRDPTDMFLDLTGDLHPLSLTTLRRSFPSLPMEGEYTGRVDFRGALSDLETVADLETSGGSLTVRARFDARRIADAYSIEAFAEGGFVLSNVLPSLPDPTRLSGTVFAQGRGLSLDAIEGDARIVGRRGSLGPLRIDSLYTDVNVRGGVLSLQGFVAETEAGRLEASGSFGLASDAPPGELILNLESEDLEPLRPFLMEEPELVLEDLFEYELEERDDLEDIPTEEEISVGGLVRGQAVVRGGFRDFAVEGSLDLRGLQFRRDHLETGALTFSAQGLPGSEARLQAEIRTDSVQLQSFAFRAGSAAVDLGLNGGRVRVAASRFPDEEYTAQGTVVLDSLDGGTVNLDEFNLHFDTVRWNLGGPASFTWSEEGYRVRDFRLVRPGIGNMRIRADGFLPLGGREGEFDLDVEELNLSLLARAIQMETALEGVVEFHGRMTGPSQDPTVVGQVTGVNLQYGDFSLGRVDSDLEYGGRRLRLDLLARDGGQQVLSAAGHFPLDLRIEPDSAELAEAPVDLSVSMDAFPAAIALAFVRSMEEVEGTISGDLHFGGVAGDLEPRGDLVLTGGSAFHPGLGVRHTGVESTFVVNPDGVVGVNGTLQSEGTATVTGNVILGSPLADPELDLTVRPRNFLAMSRRDITARLSGSVHITEHYRAPRVVGDLTVEEGVLMVEEVARSVEVVDLSDPSFFDVVPTPLVTLRPIIRASQNPFLQNMRMDVNLTMARNSWLRGRELNVELVGELGVFWDRTEQNLTFLGVLDAVRGTYSVFSRQFQVQEGTVSFPGIPGVNPDLSIRALNRLRTPRNEPLEIIATVEGSLLAPRVSLSGNSSFPIAEEDLVSYLIFGRPAYAVGRGRSDYASESAGALTGATANLAVGLFSSELGSILTRETGLDYLAVTQGAVDPSVVGTDARARTLTQTFAATQIEVGQYLTEDIFAALHWRPVTARGSELSPLAAVRIESRLSDRWTLQGYYEDRFLQTSTFLLGNIEDIKSEFSLGFFLFREWGY